jgi:hypothetical protein
VSAFKVNILSVSLFYLKILSTLNKYNYLKSIQLPRGEPSVLQAHVPPLLILERSIRNVFPPASPDIVNTSSLALGTAIREAHSLPTVKPSAAALIPAVELLLVMIKLVAVKRDAKI